MGNGNDDPLQMVDDVILGDFGEVQIPAKLTHLPLKLQKKEHEQNNMSCHIEGEMGIKKQCPLHNFPEAGHCSIE